MSKAEPYSGLKKLMTESEKKYIDKQYKEFIKLIDEGGIKFEKSMPVLDSDSNKLNWMQQSEEADADKDTFKAGIEMDVHMLDEISKKLAETAPMPTTFQYYGPPPGIGKAIMESAYGKSAEKKTFYSCMNWKKKIGWPYSPNSSDCCPKCHLKVGGHIGEHGWRHITGIAYKVCCGVKKLCIKTLESQYWCPECNKYVAPAWSEAVKGWLCFLCSYPTVESKKIKKEKSDFHYCSNCKDYKKIIYQSGTGYCNTCYWPVVSQNKQKTEQEQLDMGKDLYANSMAKLKYAAKMSKLKELYGG